MDTNTTTPQMIKICIVTSSGYEDLIIPTTEALKAIEYNINSKKRWLYVDGIHKNLDELKIEDLENARDIRMMNAMIGGVG